MIAEALFLAAASLTGVLWVGREYRGLGFLLTVGAGGATGLALLTMVQILIALVGFKLGAVAFAGLGALLLATAIVAAFMRKPPLSLILACAASIACVVAVAVLQSMIHAAVLSYDSYEYLMVSSNFYRSTTALDKLPISGFLANYAPLLFTAHAPARFWGGDFLTLFHPLVFLWTAITCSGLVHAMTRDANLHPVIRIGAVVAPAIILCLTPQVIHHAVYVMPNLPTGMLFAGAIALLWAAETRSLPQLLAPAAVCLAAIALARQEGGLMATVILVAFATAEHTSWKLKTALAASVALAATIWYVRVYFIIGDGPANSILSPAAIAVQVGGMWLVAAGCAVAAIRVLRPLVFFSAIALPIVLVAAHVVLLIIKPPLAMESLGIFVVNMASPIGLWGPWWGAALAIAAALTAVPQQTTFSRMLGLTVVSTILLVSLLGLVRSFPYRLGDQDSGNRMLLHIYPVMWAYLAARIGTAWRTQHAPSADAVEA